MMMTSGLFAIRWSRVWEELTVCPTSAIRPMRSGYLSEDRWDLRVRKVNWAGKGGRWLDEKGRRWEGEADREVEGR